MITRLSLPVGPKPLAATVGYAAAVLLLTALALDAVSGVLERKAQVEAAQELLDRMQGRRPVADLSDVASLMRGSPFLEGPSLTVAAAGLMQRVGAAATRHGGQVTSSRVEVQGAALGPGFAGVTATLELPQPELQNLLYDLEAGMPFLFVDQMDVQGPGSGETGEGRLRVVLTVYGQWQAPR